MWTVSSLSLRSTGAGYVSTRAAELAAELAHAGGDRLVQLRHELVLLYIPTADAIAHRYHGRGHAQEDLIQVARTGLVEASLRFDAARGPFGAFAITTVTGVLKRHFRDHAWSVRPPRRLQENAAVISRTQERLTRELARRPTPAETADATGLSVDDVHESRLVGLSYCATSIHAQSAGGGQPALEHDVAIVENGFAAVEIASTVQSACVRLNPADQELIYLRFFRQLSQQEVAEKFGVSQMQVSRWQRRVLTTLRDVIGDDLDLTN